MHNSEFLQRRQRLMQSMTDKSIAILPTAPERVRNRDVHFFYRPDSDFYYLTGFAEPDALLVLMPGRAQGEYILFCRERDRQKETWHGRRAGLEGACEIYQADDAFPITDVDEIIPGLLEQCQKIYYPLGCYPEFDGKINEWLNQLRAGSRKGLHFPTEIVALDHILHNMRLYKTEAEVAALQKAADISVLAHQRAMQKCRAGMQEYELEAEICHEFIRNGSRAPAYPPIIGGGENSCILHYVENNCVLKAGDLVLIDAGCEYDYYAADITRTFPVNGKFSAQQQAIYEIVLAAQMAAIEKIKPGTPYHEIYNTTLEIITQGLVDLKLLQGEVATLIVEEKYKQFYMHKAGHWLGMDVHDAGNYKIAGQWRPLEPGMVMTIEPGIYIAAHSPGVDEKWWNIGVRIEDNVLVTDTGHRVLTAGLAKTVAEIEALMTGS